MKAMCTNCHKNVDADTKTSNFASNQMGGAENEELKIWDVIAYVYRIGNISLDDLKFQFTNLNPHEDHLMDGVLEYSLGMCDICLSLLSDTYKALKQFESLTHQASLIQQVQNTCAKKWENCREVSLSPGRSVLSTKDKKVDDLFDSFNYEDDQPVDVEADDYFAEEFKYDTGIDLLENEKPSLPIQNSSPKVRKNRKKSAKKIKPSKQLVVKMEKLSDEDLKHYNEKKRIKTETETEVVELKKRKIKPVNKLQYSVAIPRKNSKRISITGGKRKKYQCKICGKSFDNRGYFHSMHMPIHSQDMDCKLCGKKFTSMVSFRLHMLIIHKQAKKEGEIEKHYKTCEICGKTIFSGYFRKHVATHGPRETLKCDKCGKEYINKSAFEEHVLTHEKNFVSYLCGHCGKKFNDTATLNVHERRHTEGDRWPCELCSKKFFVKAELKSHMETAHCDERLHACDECGATYKRKGELIKHKKIHKDVTENGEYSYQCPTCERFFRHSKSLQRHMEVHEGKYKCSFCGKILSKPDVLKNHEDLHRKNPNYQPRKYKTWRTDIARKPNPYSTQPTPST